VDVVVVVDEVGVDAGVRCGEGSEDVVSIRIGAEASCPAKLKMSEPCSEKNKCGRGRGRGCRGLGGCAPRADMVDGVDDVAVGEVGDDVAGDSVGSGVVVDSAKETGGPRVVDDVVGEVADVEVVGKTNGETAGCIVGSAVGA
jgi:hypothetical protein